MHEPFIPDPANLGDPELADLIDWRLQLGSSPPPQSEEAMVERWREALISADAALASLHTRILRSRL